MPRNKLTSFDIKLRTQISENLKKYTKGMTQLQLSERTGIPVSTLSGYFAKRSTPNAGAIQKIADALKINKSDIDPRFGSTVTVNEIHENPSTYDVPNKNHNSYNYFNTGLSAGILSEVNPFTKDDVQQLVLSDVIMGKYAGDRDIFISHINGESMNRVIPNGSLIAVKKYDSFSDLKDGDIVVFQEYGTIAVKRFYNDKTNGIITFAPDSSDSKFRPINYLYQNMNEVKILGKVVIYIVEV